MKRPMWWPAWLEDPTWWRVVLTAVATAAIVFYSFFLFGGHR